MNDMPHLLESKMYRSMDERHRNASSALITFCDTCGRRVYALGEGPSSTHLAAGGEEAMCTCKQSERGGHRHDNMRKEYDEGRRIVDENTTLRMASDTAMQASEDIFTENQHGDEEEVIARENITERLNSHRVTPSADDGEQII